MFISVIGITLAPTKRDYFLYLRVENSRIAKIPTHYMPNYKKVYPMFFLQNSTRILCRTYSIRSTFLSPRNS